MEGNLLGLDFPVFDIDLVTDKHNWYVFADTCEVLVPLWHVTVGDARANIEHNNSAISSYVVTITKTAKFLLTSCVPNIEFDLPMISEERHWMHFDSKCCDVLLLEFSSQVTLDKGSLADTTVSYEHEFEFWNLLGLFNHLNKFENVRHRYSKN